MRIRQAVERAWLLMAIISEVYQTIPLSGRESLFVVTTDRARKALFDIHRKLEYESEPVTRQRGVNSKKTLGEKAVTGDHPCPCIAPGKSIRPETGECATGQPSEALG